MSKLNYLKQYESKQTVRHFTCKPSYNTHLSIERKYEESLELPFILGEKGATWEVNLMRKKEDFADDYLRDPVTAAGMYECIPPLTVDAFFDPDKIDNCIKGRQPAS